MTGPEHYRQAEELLGQLRKAQSSMSSSVSPERVAAVMAEAQVHATLALAAATAMNDAESGMSIPDYQEWDKAAGAKANKPADPTQNIW